MKKFKRKKLNLQVKREFQKWLFIRVLGSVILSSLLAGIILYLYAHNEVTESFYDAHVKIRRVSDLLLPVVLAGGFISFVSGTILALFLPQKIAGPLYRIEAGLKDVQEGDLSVQIKIRENDPLHDFVDMINSTITAMRKLLAKAEKGGRQASIDDQSKG